VPLVVPGAQPGGSGGEQEEERTEQRCLSHGGMG
jgi:hypothetical protein